MIVVDAPAVVDALTAPDGTDRLRTRLAGEDLQAPALLDYEVLSALRGLTLSGQLSQSRAGDALTDFDDLPIVRWPFGPALRWRVFQLRHNVSGYDAAYVALAEALRCLLITRDLRLARSGGHDVEIEVP